MRSQGKLGGRMQYEFSVFLHSCTQIPTVVSLMPGVLKTMGFSEVF